MVAISQNLRVVGTMVGRSPRTNGSGLTVTLNMKMATKTVDRRFDFVEQVRCNGGTVQEAFQF